MDLVRHHLRGGEHLPSAPKPAFDVHDRLPGRALGVRDPTHAQEKDAERMQAALVHQGARHHLIVGEMARQEPVVRPDIRFRHDTADPVAPSLGIEFGDAVDQLHALSRDGERPFDLQTRKVLSERADQVSRTKRGQSFCTEGPLFHRHQLLPVGGARSSHFLVVEAATNDPFACVELTLSEEARRPLAHGQERSAVHRGVELEAEEPGIALPEEPENTNVVLDDLAGMWKLGVKRDHRVQKPIDGQALGLRVDAEVARQKKVRLARLHRDARGESPAVQIPPILEDVMLRNDAPRRHRLGLRLDARDAVDEHERLVR